MKTNVILSTAVPILVLVVMAGCGHDTTTSSTTSSTTDMTNSPPPAMSTNLPPATNTDMVNTNLTTNGTSTNHL